MAQATNEEVATCTPVVVHLLQLPFGFFNKHRFFIFHPGWSEECEPTTDLVTGCNEVPLELFYKTLLVKRITSAHVYGG